MRKVQKPLDSGRIAFSTHGTGATVVHGIKWILRCFTCFTKNNLKRDHRLKWQAQSTDRLALIEIKNFWSVAGPFKSINRKAKYLEKISANHISDKELVPKIFPLENGQNVNVHFNNKDIQIANKHTERCSTALALEKFMLKLHWGCREGTCVRWLNGNGKHTIKKLLCDISTQISEWLKLKIVTKQNMDEGVKKVRHSYIAGENLKGCKLLWETV